MDDGELFWMVDAEDGFPDVELATEELLGDIVSVEVGGWDDVTSSVVDGACEVERLFVDGKVEDCSVDCVPTEDDS